MTVLCHVTGFDVDLSLEDRDFLRHYAYRALVAARSSDIVILPDLPIPEEELHLLSEMGLGPDHGNVFTTLASVHGSSIQPFNGACTKTRELAMAERCHVVAPTRMVCKTSNSKAWFQHTFNGIPEACVPDGFVCTRTQCTQRIEQISRFFGRARIKVAGSASGHGQTIVARNGQIVLPDGRAGDELVVQADVRRDADASVQFEITERGSRTVGPVIGQHIKDGKHHGGNFYPTDASLHTQPLIPVNLQTDMLRAAEFITHKLAESGYWGPGGIDFVVDLAESRVWAVEVNARITAPQYPLRAAMARFGRHVPFDLRSFSFPLGMPPSRVFAHFEGLTLRADTRIGFVPFTILPSFGRAIGMTLAQTPDELASLVAEVEARKSTLL